MQISWKTYEEVAAYLLNNCAAEFGLQKVEPKQKISGNRSGTNWVIDAKGIKQGDEGFVIIECRRYNTSRQNQEKIGGLAYRILDTGAQGGIVVSPLGLQKGAKKISEAENIIHVTLSPDSTPHEFYMKFLNKIFIGIQFKTKTSISFSAEVIRTCITCGSKFQLKNNEKECPECAQRSQNQAT